MISDKIRFIYTNIGRGHPFYLDGIIEALIQKAGIKAVKGGTDVFELSRGIPLLAWKAVRATYRAGASEGIAGKIYARLRRGADYNQPGLMLDILGRDIRHAMRQVSDCKVVAHPLLVAILKGEPGLVYQHGELAAPTEACVRGAEYVLVPTEHAARMFINAGYDSQQVIITGLCIEPALVKQAADCYKARLNRINGQEPLTGAFFSSGAEPKAHVEQMAKCAALTASTGDRSIILAARDGRFAKTAKKAFAKWSVPALTITSSDVIPAELPQAMIVEYSGRRELDRFTARLFSRFDYLVAPSHERTNWALGLGLPMFAVRPAYGPFAPLNMEILMESGAAECLDREKVNSFPGFLKGLRQHGALSEMSSRGWDRYEINGFAVTADFLLNYCGAKVL